MSNRELFLILSLVYLKGCNVIVKSDNMQGKSLYDWHDVLTSKCSCERPVALYKDIYSGDRQGCLNVLLLRWECYEKTCFLPRISSNKLGIVDFGMRTLLVVIEDISGPYNKEVSNEKNSVQRYVHLLESPIGVFNLCIDLPSSVILVHFGKYDSTLSTKVVSTMDSLYFEDIYKVLHGKDTFYFSVLKSYYVSEQIFKGNIIIWHNSYNKLLQSKLEIMDGRYIGVANSSKEAIFIEICHCQ